MNKKHRNNEQFQQLSVLDESPLEMDFEAEDDALSELNDDFGMGGKAAEVEIPTKEPELI